MSSDIVFIALSTFCERDGAPLDLLRRSGRPFRVHATGKRITTPELLRDGSDASVIVAGVETYDAATLAALPALRCISRCGVGTDAIDLNAARERGVAVLNTPDVPTAAVAELALAMFLSLCRTLRPQANRMKARNWVRLESHLLGARCVGIVGLGRIGHRVAALCQGFGSLVVATDPAADADAERERNITLMPLEQLLETADIVSLHAANVAGSPLRLGAAELARMKQGAILVNLARGSMVDDEALAEALRSGHLAGAGLDVFPVEPYAGPLCDFEQVILTPHSATLPVETRAAMELQCVGNALRFLDGRIERAERVV